MNEVFLLGASARRSPLSFPFSPDIYFFPPHHIHNPSPSEFLISGRWPNVESLVPSAPAPVPNAAQLDHLSGAHEVAHEAAPQHGQRLVVEVGRRDAHDGVDEHLPLGQLRLEVTNLALLPPVRHRQLCTPNMERKIVLSVRALTAYVW